MAELAYLEAALWPPALGHRALQSNGSCALVRRQQVAGSKHWPSSVLPSGAETMAALSNFYPTAWTGHMMWLPEVAHSSLAHSWSLNKSPTNTEPLSWLLLFRFL